MPGDDGEEGDEVIYCEKENACSVYYHICIAPWKISRERRL